MDSGPSVPAETIMDTAPTNKEDTLPLHYVSTGADVAMSDEAQAVVANKSTSPNFSTGLNARAGGQGTF